MGLELDHSAMMARPLLITSVSGSPAEKAGIDFDWEILNIETVNDRPPRQLMFIPALLLSAWYRTDAKAQESNRR